MNAESCGLIALVACSVESLPADVLTEDEYAAKGSRYDNQVAVFGHTIQVRNGCLCSLRTESPGFFCCDR